MSVILDQYELFYAAVPKIACTSIKKMFFAIENGRPFVDYKTNGVYHHIHNSGYATLLYQDFPQGRIRSHHRVTVVRDPVKRFLSAYGNRVIHHGELSVKAAGKMLQTLALEPTPELPLFIERYEDYSKAHKSILHHTRPLVDFLGDDPGYYSSIYKIEQIADFTRDIAERVGIDVKIGREQRGGPKFSPEDLTFAQREKIEGLYARDYAVWGKYF